MRTVGAAAFLLSASMLCSAAAQPTATPVPWDGPELDIVFTGVVLYKQLPGTDPAYDVILSRVPHHYAYIRFPTSAVDLQETNMYLGTPFSCGGITTRFAVLARDDLRLDPESAIVDAKLEPGTALQSVARLSKLVDSGTKYDPGHERSGANVAALFELRRGTLIPALEPNKEPIYWEFKNKKDCSGKPIDTICAGSGILAKIRIKKGQGKDLKIASSQAGRKLKLNLKDGEITTIHIGNSRNEDIGCPQGGQTPVADKDFEYHYKVLKNTVGKYIPCPTSTQCSFRDGGEVVILSLRGSNCIGAQWP